MIQLCIDIEENVKKPGEIKFKFQNNFLLFIKSFIIINAVLNKGIKI